ncbi:MAG: PfkB family carbohydrate kinase [Beijerinckiaceae bacterium]|nr:PfkB family carbohydrate kinase [Beijerinckiaceae bacterium]MCZ8301002.1 PfkB family carbohydrate kinase [Beijerinckiaceae bacterium]
MRSLMTIGIVVLDEVLTIPLALKPGEKHRAIRSDSVMGGNAANAALAIARLGGKARLIARIGDDASGRMVRQKLAEFGIDDSLSPPMAGIVTSRSSIIIEPGGDRTIVNFLDPRMPDRPDWLPASLPAGTAAVLGDTRWETGAGHLFDLARQAGIPAVFDGDRAPLDRSLLARASHVIFSAIGLRETTGMPDLHQGLLAVRRESESFLAVTDGSDGVLALLPDGLWHIPSLDIRAVDTLGAGDVWHGAFAWALTERLDLLDAIQWANATAALKCLRPGGSSGAPERHEVEAALPGLPAPKRLVSI